jgi:cell division protein FtsB
MRWLTVTLATLLVAIQYPLWLGKGGWFRVAELEQQVKAQVDANGKLKARNDALSADVKDLQTGTAAIEERARVELGMVKPDEIFVQVIDPTKSTAPSPNRMAASSDAAN